MTGRNDRGAKPGRGIAGVIAAAVVLTLGAQGAVGAPSEKKQRERTKPAATQAEAAKAKPAPGTGIVTRSVGGVQVAIDPKTGKVQPPTVEQAAALRAELQHMLSRDTEGLAASEQPDGTLMMALDDTFQQVIMATVDQRGRVRLQCVDDPSQAIDILDGTAKISTDAPVYTRVRVENPKGAKMTRDPVVKE
jgi:hypothetical protein